MVCEEGVMYEHPRIRAPEHTGKPYLPAGRWKQVLAPNHQSNSVPHVVHRDRKLVGPVAQAVVQQQVAALRGGILNLRS
jgi:hypothetical protein